MRSCRLYDCVDVRLRMIDSVYALRNCLSARFDRSLLTSPLHHGLAALLLLHQLASKINAEIPMEDNPSSLLSMVCQLVSSCHL